MTAEIASPRPGGWYYGWNIVGALMLVLIAAMGMAVSGFSLFLHDWSTDLKVSISTLQLAVTPGALMSAISGAFIGGLADRYPARWLIGGGLLGLAAFNFCLSFVTSSWQFIALFALVLPILLNLTTLIVANPLVSRWFVRRLGLALGLTVLGTGLAGMVVPPLVAVAMPLVGWRGVWRISAGVLALVVVPVIFAVVRERPTEREGFAYVGATAGALSDHHHRGGLSRREIIGRKNFWFVAAMYLPIYSAYQGILYNLAPIAASHGVGPQAAGTLLAVLSLTQMAATPLLGMLSDRFGNRLPFLGLALVTAAGAGLFAFAGGLPALVVASALIGVGGAVWTLLGAAIAVEYGSANAGQAFGLLIAFVPIAALFSFVVAKLKEVTGGYAIGILIMTAMLGIAAVASLVMRERRSGPATPEERTAAMKEAVSGSPI